MKSFSFHRVLGSAHDRVSVFAGSDREHRVLCGTLLMSRDESTALWLLLNLRGQEPIDIVAESHELLEIEVGRK